MEDVPWKQDPFRTYVVLEFSSKIPKATGEWLLSKITLAKSLGGGELLAKPILDENGEETIIHLSATLQRLMVAAEEMQLKKPYKDGSLHEISLDDLDHFQDHEDLDNFLTLAEKQRIILHELEIIRAMESDYNIPGLRGIKLYEHEAIIPKCMNEDIILNVFPLHEKEALKVLGDEWYRKIISPQPLEKIQKYFGETIAMYFAFLGFYTMALLPPALIGIMSIFLGHDNVNMMVFFSIFNLVWATVFLEAWKQNCATLAYKWGTINFEQFEEPRAQYKGKLGVNKITGHLEPQYPKWRRMVKFYCVSLPIVIVCLFLAFLVMLKYFWMQDYADMYSKLHPGVLGIVVKLSPSMIYAVEINIMNAGYRRLAHYLNDWENHRLQSEYDNHIIIKLVSFDFANCFMSLFYVAFYMRDMALLRSHLGTLLIIQQVIGQVQETVLPYLMYRRRKQHVMDLMQERENGEDRRHRDSDIGVEPLRTVTNNDDEIPEEYVKQAQIEISKSEYEGTLDDYLEMFLQFGYVFLFSAVFPTAAFWALLNNVTEIRSDGFKLCRITRRPFAQPAEGIGAWQIAFEMMSVIAVITNTALIALSPKVQEYVPEYGILNVFLVFVIAEHLILFIKITLSYLIPDAPDWVSTALAREDYRSKQALRKQRGETATKAFERRLSRYHLQQSEQTPLLVLPGGKNRLLVSLEESNQEDSAKLAQVSEDMTEIS